MLKFRRHDVSNMRELFPGDGHIAGLQNVGLVFRIDATSSPRKYSSASSRVFIAGIKIHRTLRTSTFKEMQMVACEGVHVARLRVR
jgi:hypothetical protein